MHWTGCHVEEIHGLESRWGLSYETAAVAFTEAPEEKLVLLRIASREDGDEMISILSTDEATSLRSMICYAEQAVNYKRGDDELRPATADDGMPQR